MALLDWFRSISQAHRTTGLRLAGIADLSRDRALAALKRCEYDNQMTIEEGIKAGKTAITTDSVTLISNPDIDVILEVTGNPAAGIRHALLVRS
jgi:predicted homoserine dehydrogenase-like protein